MTPDPLCTQQPTGRGGWGGEGGDTHEWRHLQGHKSKRRTRESRTPTTLPREPEVLFWLCLEFRGQQLPKGWPTRPAQSRRVEREGLNERGKVLLYCGKSRRIEAMPGLRLTETDFSATKRIFLFDFHSFQRFIEERKWKYTIHHLLIVNFGIHLWGETFRGANTVEMEKNIGLLFIYKQFNFVKLQRQLTPR